MKRKISFKGSKYFAEMIDNTKKSDGGNITIKTLEGRVEAEGLKYFNWYFDGNLSVIEYNGLPKLYKEGIPHQMTLELWDSKLAKVTDPREALDVFLGYSPTREPEGLNARYEDRQRLIRQLDKGMDLEDIKADNIEREKKEEEAKQMEEQQQQGSPEEGYPEEGGYNEMPPEQPEGEMPPHGEGEEQPSEGEETRPQSLYLKRVDSIGDGRELFEYPDGAQIILGPETFVPVVNYNNQSSNIKPNHNSLIKELREIYKDADFTFTSLFDINAIEVRGESVADYQEEILETIEELDPGLEPYVSTLLTDTLVIRLTNDVIEF